MIKLGLATSLLLFILLGISFTFILIYSAMLYRKIIKIEPEFFVQKNIFYYISKINHTQFIFYVLFNYHKKIRDVTISKQCYYLRNFSYAVICGFIFILIFGF